MRVAALYDVHGNLPALDAVLGQVPDEATIVLGGDIVSGPFPAETLERLRDFGERAIWIRGNADRELRRGEPALGPPETTEWVRAQLSADDVEFLASLPLSTSLDVGGLGKVLFCHATPRNDVDIFTSLTPEDRLRPVFADAGADVVVVGHTHVQFDRSVAGVRVVNAGSVGMAYEDEQGAYWALLGPDVELRRADYELDLGTWPHEWPSASRSEAEEHFESVASF